jgi:hypothetical protein
MVGGMPTELLLSSRSSFLYSLLWSVYIAISIRINPVVRNLLPLYTPCSHYFVLHFQEIYLHNSFMMYKVLFQSFHSYVPSGASIVCFRTCICKNVTSCREYLDGLWWYNIHTICLENWLYGWKSERVGRQELMPSQRGFWKWNKRGMLEINGLGKMSYWRGEGHVAGRFMQRSCG